MSARNFFNLLPGKAAGHIDRVPILILNSHSRCNCRCVMCDIWRVAETRSLSQADLRPHLHSIAALGVRQVVFSGGEPLMNPGLWLLCRMLRAGGIRLTLLSTGLLFEKYAAEIVAELDEAIVSLDGPPEVHDAIRGVKGAFEQLQKGIDSVRRQRAAFPISARTTVQKLNFRHLLSTVAVARQMGFDSISFLAADLTSQAFNRPVSWSSERQAEIGIGEAEIHDLEEEIEQLIEDRAADIQSGFVRENPAKLRRIVRHFQAYSGLCEPEAPACNAPWVSAVIEADGTVRPCFFHPPIGNLENGPLRSILNGPKAVAFREQLDMASDPICRRCVCSLHYRSGSHTED